MDNPITTLRIFLSYGHDRHTTEALRIKADLEKRGHNVWFDVQRIKEGRDWELYIEEGLKECDKVVLLMTPYSVRRRNPRDPASRDGYCLNEIAKALERNKLIIPVLLVELEAGPPTSICRIQYLDLRDSVPISERESRYLSHLDRLIRAIEHNDLDFDGGQARLNKLLKPLNFDDDISRHIASFTGRRWMMDELDRWLSDKPGSRVFWLTGGPGVGKTAVTVHLCHTRHDVIAFHLCIHGHDDKADPRRALLSIAYQIAQHFPVYDQRINALELEAEVIKNPQTLFDTLLVQPFTGDFPAPDGSRLVVIDAIDEATKDGRNEIARFIRDYWSRTPSWMRLIITSRPEAAVITQLANFNPYVLYAQSPDNLRDMVEFLRAEFTRRKLVADNQVVSQILDKSDGLFLYVVVVLEELDKGTLSLARLDQFPVGLAGYYQRFFERQFPNTSSYQGQVKLIVEATCAQLEPLPLSLLMRTVNMDEVELRKCLALLGSLFPIRGTVVIPFHRSVVDWLTAKDERTGYLKAGDYAINSSAGNARLAEGCWSEYQDDVNTMTEYAIRHIRVHLDRAGDIVKRRNVEAHPAFQKRLKRFLPQAKVMRVWLSSTFRDMHAERDYLVRIVFPQLRKLSESRGIIFTEVDLRWGVTEEQAAENEALPIVLEEINRCRPYFIGLLGERYGWVPKKLPPDLIERYPWLAEQRGRSVVELEALHGVLHQEQIHEGAFFYFRDPSYLDHLPPGSSRVDFESEAPDPKTKLAQLKQRIRHASAEQVCQLRENYRDPKELGQFVLNDFTELINKLYPKEEIAHPLDQEAAGHEDYAQSRRLAFVGREDLLYRLDQHAISANKPLVLTGDSGCGKSTLLAEWAALWRKDHPDDIVIQHFIGSTPDSANWHGLVRRILGELERAFAITGKIKQNIRELPNQLREFLAKVPADRRVVLVLDALNQLVDDGATWPLSWLPVIFPANFRVLVSTLSGESMDALRKRGWPELKVPLFARADIATAAQAYFRIYAKTAPAGIVAKLESTPAAVNPLYLRAVLNELRQLGKYELLDAKAADYLTAPDLTHLYDRILERWELDYGGIVRQSLSLLCIARRGLSEVELLDLLGNHSRPLPRMKWTPFYLTAESSLVQRAGLLGFFHHSIHEAVTHRFLSTPHSKAAEQHRLADYFESQPVSARSCDEVPWLLFQAKSYDRLHNYLLDMERFLKIMERDPLELMRYWVWMRKERMMGNEYLISFERWVVDNGDDLSRVATTAYQLAVFLNDAALHSEAELLYRRTLAIDEQILDKDHPNVTRALNNLGSLLQATNRLKDAEPLMRQALAIDESRFGPEHPSVARDLNNLTALLQATNRLAEAEPLMRRALVIDERSFGMDHPSVARDLNNLAALFQATNRLAEAEPLVRRALAIDEQVFGPIHPNVATDLNNLATLLQSTNRLAEAEPLMRKTLAILEESLGPEHPNVAASLNNLAQLLLATDRLAEAEPLIRRALAIAEQSFGPEHPSVATALNNLAQLLQATGRLAGAEPLMRRALAIAERSYGAEHPDVANRLNNLAQLLQATGRLAEAEPLIRRALAIAEQSFGPEHPSVATALNNLAQLLQATGRLVEAEMLMRHALSIAERSYGAEHSDVANRLTNLAQLLKAMDRLTEAEPLMRRALSIAERSYGAEHPDIANRLNNLAQLLQATDRLEEAEPLIRRALAIAEQSFGPEHPSVAFALNNLAQLLKAMDRLAEAEPLFRRALAIALSSRH